MVASRGETSAHPGPVTGASGSRPIGIGIGAATAVLAGRSAAEVVNPTIAGASGAPGTSRATMPSGLDAPSDDRVMILPRLVPRFPL